MAIWNEGAFIAISDATGQVLVEDFVPYTFNTSDNAPTPSQVLLGVVYGWGLKNVGTATGGGGESWS